MCIETCAATLIEGLSAPCFDKKNEDKTNGFKTPRGGLLNNVVIDFPIMYFSIFSFAGSARKQVVRVVAALKNCYEERKEKKRIMQF